MSPLRVILPTAASGGKLLITGRFDPTKVPVELTRMAWDGEDDDDDDDNDEVDNDDDDKRPV